jgi:hypothetical protein
MKWKGNDEDEKHDDVPWDLPVLPVADAALDKATACIPGACDARGAGDDANAV